MSAGESEELFTVPDKEGRPVPAKMLTVLGSRVLDDGGRPIIVPASYDAGKFAALVRANAAERVLRFGSLPSRELEELKGFWRGLRYDLQRAYNGATSGGRDGSVGDFTPAASFALGYTAASLSVPENVTMFGGGVHNMLGLLENRHQNI